MTESADFLALRNCFLPPIPELERATDLLNEAANCLLSNECEQAREKVRLADIPAIFSYANRIMGAEDLHIHRRRQVAVRPKVVDKTGSRMPSAALVKEMYARDGWRCRFCGCRIIMREARDKMRAALPGAVPWGESRGIYHAAFYALTAVADHVVPHAYGGGNGLENLVTACWPCNFGRGSWSLGEVGLFDPRLRPPVVDDWDGLGRLSSMTRPYKASIVRPIQEKTTMDIAAGEKMIRPTKSSGRPAMAPFAEAWITEIDRICPMASSRLLNFAEDCANLGVSCGINKVMIIRMRVGNITIQPFGIEANGEVSIPWFLSGMKTQFRHFAHVVADSIQGAIVSESPHQWIVKKPERKVHVVEFLGALAPIHVALRDLNLALRTPD